MYLFAANADIRLWVRNVQYGHRSNTSLFCLCDNLRFVIISYIYVCCVFGGFVPVYYTCTSNDNCSYDKNITKPSMEWGNTITFISYNVEPIFHVQWFWYSLIRLVIWTVIGWIHPYCNVAVLCMWETCSPGAKEITARKIRGIYCVFFGNGVTAAQPFIAQIKLYFSQHNDVTWASWSLNSRAILLQVRKFFHANNKGNQNSATIIFVMGIQWWVPVKKDEKCGKCFNMRTTSCSEVTTASTPISYRYQDQIRLQLRVLSILSSSFTP